MAIFRERLAPREAIASVFALCVLTIQAWAFVNLFREVPALRIRMGFWEMLGTVAYVQAFALLESLLVLGMVLLLAALLPARWLRARFAAQGSALVLVSALWAVAIHYNGGLASWTGGQMAGWAAGYLLSVGASWALIGRYPKVEAGITEFGRGLVVLAMLYAFVGVISIIVVIVRNL